MIKYLGNSTSVINWNEVIKDLENSKPDEHGPRHKKGDQIPGVPEIIDLWMKAGYKSISDGGTIGWDMYYPGTNFDQAVVDKFIDFFNLGEEVPLIHSAWISKIHPGMFAPWHWDVQDTEEELLTQDDFPRYHCHIGNPQFGHIFICEEQCFYNQDQGASYRWNSRRYWHAGTNCGLTPKYLFNLW